MRSQRFRWIVRSASFGAIGLTLLVFAVSANAQGSSRPSGSSGGSSGGSSFSGSSGGSSFSGGSFSGSSGSSFSGGSSSGGSFSGGSFSGSGGSSFSGGGSFSGGSMAGGSFGGGSTGRSTSGGTGNIFYGVSQTNPFYLNYQNPISIGLKPPGQWTISSNLSKDFGMPSYGTQNLLQNTGSMNTGMTGSTTAFTPIGNTSGLKVLAVSAGNRMQPSPNPATPVYAGRLFGDAQAAIQRSNTLSAKHAIQVGVEGRTVVLRGVVSDERERRAAENTLRFTPGVSEVRNELTIGTPPPPTVRRP